MAYNLTWLADVLREAGLKVEEQDGWQTRGRSDMSAVRGIICHHTGGALTGNAPSLATVIHGRADLTGPLSHLVLGRDGTFYVVAAGKCNHAGEGKWRDGARGVDITDGNAHFIGIEAENAGTAEDPWPLDQMEAYERGCAAILMHIGCAADMVMGHREYATPRGRKIDPLFDMDHFRDIVKIMMVKGEVHPQPIEAYHAMLHKGDHGPDVRDIQRKLGLEADGVFWNKTEEALKAFQTKNNLVADGLVGPKTWEALTSK